MGLYKSLVDEFADVIASNMSTSVALRVVDGRLKPVRLDPYTQTILREHKAEAAARLAIDKAMGTGSRWSR